MSRATRKIREAIEERQIDESICLAGSGRDQLQSFGRGKKEQLLEERGCGPELLAASL